MENTEEERETGWKSKIFIADLSVPVAFRKTPPHHVRHAQGFDSQQVEDHSVGKPELRVEDGRFSLNQIKRRKSMMGM